MECGRSYALSDNEEFDRLLQKLGVEDIMNEDDQLIPMGFESLVDGGKYTLNVPKPSRPKAQRKLTEEDATDSETDEGSENPMPTDAQRPTRRVAPFDASSTPAESPATQVLKKRKVLSTQKQQENLHSLIHPATNKEDLNYIERNLRAGEWEHHTAQNYQCAVECYRRALTKQLCLYGKNDPCVASTYSKIGSALHDFGNLKEALKECNEALRIRLAVFRDPSEPVANSYAYIGYIYYDQGEYDSALEWYKKALKTYSKLKNRELDEAQVHNYMGFVYKDRLEYNKAIEQHQTALKIQRKFLGKEGEEVATTISNLASMFDETGKLEEAVKQFQEALNIRLKLFGKDHLEVAKTKNDLGVSLNSLGKYDEALEMHQEALKSRKKKLKLHADVAQSHNNIGNVLTNQGQFKEAEAAYRSVLAIQLQLDENDPNIADTQNNIGDLFSKQGKHGEALAAFGKALKIQEKNNDVCPLDIAKTYFNMGCVLENKKDYDEAMKKYERAYAKQISKNDPAVADTLNGMGRIYRFRGEYDEAMRLHKKALHNQRKSLGDRHVDVGETYVCMGDVLNDEGSSDEARDHYRKALSIYEKEYEEGDVERIELEKKLAEC